MAGIAPNRSHQTVFESAPGCLHAMRAHTDRAGAREGNTFSSCGSVVVVMPEQPAEPFLAGDFAAARRFAWRPYNQSVSDALMWPLGVIVLGELVAEAIQMTLTADQKVKQAFVLKRLDETSCDREL